MSKHKSTNRHGYLGVVQNLLRVIQPIAFACVGLFLLSGFVRWELPEADASTQFVVSTGIAVNSLDDTIADDGACTLREAITSANTDTASGTLAGECAAGSGADTINFALGTTGVQTITLGSALPTIGTEMTIDGSTHSGTLIVDGPGNVINITADNVTLNNFAMRATGTAITVSGTNGVTLSQMDAGKVDACSFSGSGTGINVSNATNLTIENSSVANRGYGMLLSGGSGYTVTGNDFSGAGCANVGRAFGLNGVTGVTAHNNTFTGASSGVMIDNMSDLAIVDASSRAPNAANTIVLEDTSGVGDLPGGSLVLNNVMTTTISGLDLSRVNACAFSGSGTGINVSSATNLTIENTSVANRGYGILLSGGSGYTVTGNDFSGAGCANVGRAFGLNGVNGVTAHSNDFSNASSGLRIENMNNLVISGTLPSNAENTIVLEEDSGVGNVAGTSLYFNDVTTATVTGINLSRAGGCSFSGSGTGFSINNSHNLVIDNIKAENRGYGVLFNAGTDVEFTNSDLSGSGCANVGRSLGVVNMEGFRAYGNDFTGVSNGLRIENINNLVISGTTPSAVENFIVLDSTSGIGGIAGTSIYLGNAVTATVSGVNLSRTAACSFSGSGTGMQVSNVTNLEINNIFAQNRGYGLLLNGTNGLNLDGAYLQGSGCANVGRSLDLSGVVNSNVRNVYIKGGSTGLSMSNTDTSTLRCISAQDTNVAFSIGGSSTGINIFDSLLQGNNVGVQNSSSEQVLAENNYWGAPDGPSNLGGLGDSFSGDVDVEPFLGQPAVCVQPGGPVANDDVVTISVNGESFIDVIANDTDPNRDPLTIEFVSDAAHGSTSIFKNEIVYAPDLYYIGADVFTYTVSDGVLTDNATVTITVETPIPDIPPVAVDDSFSTTINATLVITPPGVLGNDISNGNELTATLVTDVATGTLTLTPDGSLTYVPPVDWTGTVTATYALGDPGYALDFDGGVEYVIAPLHALSVTNFTLEMWVNPSVAQTMGAFQWATGTGSCCPFVYMHYAGSGVMTAYVNGNYNLDADVPQNVWTHLALTYDGSLYTFYENGTSVDTFSGSVSEQNNSSSIYLGNGFAGYWKGKIDDVRVWDYARSAAEIQANYQTTLTGSEAGLMSYWALDDGTGTTAVDSAGGIDGTLMNMEPDTDWVDGVGLSNVATITITVTAPDTTNDPPVANDDTPSTDEDTPLTIDALANDTDPEGDTLTILSFNQPFHGVVAQVGNSFVYTPTENYNGTDIFAYTISDGALGDSATVTVTVNAVDDPSVSVDDTYDGTEDETLTVDAPGVLTNDSDVDGDALSVSLATDVVSGSLSLNSDGSFSYEPAANFNGDVTFAYNLVTTARAVNATGTVTLTIAPVNDAPVALDDDTSLGENAVTDLTTLVLSNDSDLEGDSLVVSALDTSGTRGSVVLTGTNVIYDPGFNFESLNTGETDSDSFAYTLSDGNGGIASATVAITITGENDVPTAVNDEYFLQEDSKDNLLEMFTNDYDPEGDAFTLVAVGELSGSGIITPALSINDVLYTPETDFFGTETFTYTLEETNTGRQVTAEVVINVQDVPEASYQVTNLNDNGEGSLRQLLADTPEGKTITFADGVSGTITLASTLELNKNITVDGVGRRIVLSGGDAVRVLKATSGNLTLTRLTIANGFAIDGNASGLWVGVEANVTLNQVTVRDNSADFYFLNGVGIYNQGTLTLNNSTVSGNSLMGTGFGFAGGIYSHGVLTLNNSTVTGNSASITGGIYAEQNPFSDTPVGTVTLQRSIIAGNTTTIPGQDSNAEIFVSNIALTIDAYNIFGQSGVSGFWETPAAGLPGATDIVPAGGIETILDTTLADNGGSTDTHALPLGSPALNAIPIGTSECGMTLVVDQRDVARPAGAGCEIGAFEYEETTVNEAPVANDDEYQVVEGETLTVDAASGLLKNDTDAEGNILSVVSPSDLFGGKLTLAADGSFIFDSVNSHLGVFTFTYQTADAFGTSAAATVSMEVTRTATTYDVPMTGIPVPELYAFDQAMLDYMETKGIESGTLAVMKDGVVVYERGFGWMDAEHTALIPPDALLRIASISKPLTAAAIQDQITAGTINASDKAYCETVVQTDCWLDLTPYGTQDARLWDITIQHLLDHKAGWDRSVMGDPMFDVYDISVEMGVSSPISQENIARYMMGQALQTAPGDTYAYSNVGYLLLGLILEEATGRDLTEYIQTEILAPLGIPATEFELGMNRPQDRNPREPWYSSKYNGTSLYPPHDSVSYPDGAMHVEAFEAHGGFITTGRALLEFANAYRMNGIPVSGGTWDYGFTGSMAGTRTVLHRMPNGVIYAVLFNTRDHSDSGEIWDVLEDVANAVDVWPATEPQASPSAPVTAPDSFTAVGVVSAGWDVLANDTDADNPWLVVTGFDTSTINGTVSTDGNFINYTAPATSVAQETFTYQVSDGFNTATGTVTVALTPESNPLIVTTNADSGTGSLRQIVADAPADSTITFHPSLSGTLITLAGTIDLRENVTIDGSGNNIMIAGDGSFRLLYVRSGHTTVRQLTITNGGNSAIANVATLTVDTVNFFDNKGTEGGAIKNDGVSAVLTVTDSAFVNNSASMGGAIHNRSGSATITNSTFSGNSAGWGGGAVASRETGGTDLTITGSTFASNTAGDGGGGAVFSQKDASLSGNTFSGNSSTWAGGGVLNAGGTMSIVGDAFVANTATYAGGFFSDKGIATIANSSFISNTVSKDGGGVKANRADLTLTNLLIQDNTALGKGGGVHAWNTTVLITDSQIISNTGKYGGGVAAYESESTAEIHNTTISGNDADREGAAVQVVRAVFRGSNLVIAKNISGNVGGGIHLWDSTGTLERTQVSDNQAKYGGGYIGRNGSDFAITEVFIEGNTSSSSGGGILNENSTLSLYKSTVSENEGVGGAGIQNQPNATMYIENSTVSGNITTKWGAGLRNESASTLTVLNSTIVNNGGHTGGGSNLHNYKAIAVLTNTILAGATTVDDCWTGGGGTVTGAFNLIEDGSCSPTFQGEPMLEPLADNGGFAPTHALSPVSPALDAGDDTTCLAKDQVGTSRPVGYGCDLGAYEFPTSGPLANTDEARTNEETPITIPVLDNDAESVRLPQALSLTGVTTPTNGGGTAEIVDNAILFTPANDFNGATAFSYSLFNGVLTDTGRVVVIVDPVNDTPEAVNNEYNIVAGTPSISLDVLSNDTDADVFDTLRIISVGTPSGGGSAVINGDNIDFSPGIASGEETFDYTISDGIAQATGTVTVNVLEAACIATHNDGSTVFASPDATALRDAVSAATSGGTVKVAGTCVGVVVEIIDTVPYTHVLSIDKDLTLLGGFNPASDWTSASPLAYPTVLDASQGGRVVYIASGADVTIEGLTIQNGVLSSGHGAGIWDQGTLTLQNTKVLSNSTPTGDGGGLYVHKTAGTTQIESSTFAHNIAMDGAGMYIRSAAGTTMVATSVYSNTAADDGGGLRAHADNLDIQDSVFFGNTAAFGGGLFLIGTTDITNTTISFNKATNRGGGIYMWCCWGRTLTLSHVTMSGNMSRYSGSNIRNRSTLVLKNSVLANGTKLDGVTPKTSCYNMGTVTLVGNNLVDDGTCITTDSLHAETDIVADPLLGLLQDNGGSTLTHALLDGSPAINAGDTASCTTTDQRGELRDALCDMGAFEAAYPDLTLSNLSLDTPQACLANPFTFNLNVNNLTPKASDAFTIGIYDDAGPDGFSNLIQTVPVDALVGIDSRALTISVAPSVTGTRYIKMLADDGNAIFENTEDNNSLSALVQVNSAIKPNASITADQGGVATSTNLDFTIAVLATDACTTSPVLMRFIVDGAYTSWEPFATTKSLTVTGADGDVVTVYLQLQDSQQNLSDLIGATVTLDLSAPNTEVFGPSGSSSATSFEVFWGGNDEVSAITGFDIQVRDDAGDWTDWITGTLANNATFTSAEFNHTYCFRSRGTDAESWVEAYPSGNGDTCISVVPPLSGTDLAAERFTIMQSIQNAANSVPLILEKPTLVRLQLDIGDEPTLIEGVTAALHVGVDTDRDGTLSADEEFAGSPIHPDNAPFTAKANPDPNQTTDLMHWILPTEWLSGTIAMYIEIDPDNTITEDNDANNRWPVTGVEEYTFYETNPLEVHIVPIPYKKNGEFVMEWSEEELIRSFDYSINVYPITEIKFVIHEPYLHPGENPDDWVKFELDGDVYEMTHPNSGNVLRGIRLLGESELPNPQPWQKYHGINLHPRFWSAGGVAYLPGFVGMSANLAQTTVAHELGHNYGGPHAPCGKVRGPDQNYPYEGAVIQYQGWDAVDNRIIPANWVDFLSYCSPKWISDYGFTRVFRQIVVGATARSQARTVNADEMLSVSGFIPLEGLGGTLGDVVTLPNPDGVLRVGNANGATGGEYRLSLWNSAGEEVYVHSFEKPEVSHMREGINQVGFAINLPIVADLQYLRLYYQGFLLDEIEAGTAPVVNITSTPPTSLDSPYTLTWTGDADTYMVRYSPDNGTSWRTLAPTITETQYTIDPNYLSGTTQGLFVVIASKDLQTTSSQLGPFTVETKAPVAAISAPEAGADGALYNTSELVAFAGTGTDVEDGNLTGNSLAWSSNRDGLLGYGTSLQVDNLTTGVHTITLTVTDSDSKTSEATVQVEVLAPSITVRQLAVTGVGEYVFGNTGITLNVASADACLQSLTVKRYQFAHPNTDNSVADGEYWAISQTGCDPADDEAFFIDITLPADQPDSNSEICRWSVEEATWGCAADSFDASAGTVTRLSVTELGDFALGVSNFEYFFPIIFNNYTP